jgi:hypothetical protein
MATKAQIEANRRNAQNSTGPKTAEGKAKSCMNRLSHGFAARISILPSENEEEFLALARDLMEEHQPVTMTEQILVEKMAQAQWLTQRALNLQGEAFRTTMEKGEEGIPKSLALLIRYHTTAERAFHKAHQELVKARKERRNREIGFEPQNAAEPQPATPPEPRNPDPNNLPPGFFETEPDLDLVEKVLRDQIDGLKAA